MCSGAQAHKVVSALFMADHCSTGDTPNWASIFNTSSYITSANLPAKASHMAKPRICEGGKYTLPIVGKMQKGYWLSNNPNNNAIASLSTPCCLTLLSICPAAISGDTLVSCPTFFRSTNVHLPCKAPLSFHLFNKAFLPSPDRPSFSLPGHSPWPVHKQSCHPPGLTENT